MPHYDVSTNFTQRALEFNVRFMRDVSFSAKRMRCMKTFVLRPKIRNQPK